MVIRGIECTAALGKPQFRYEAGRAWEDGRMGGWDEAAWKRSMDCDDGKGKRTRDCATGETAGKEIRVGRKRLW